MGKNNPTYKIDLVAVLKRLGKNNKAVRAIATSPEFKSDFAQSVIDDIVIRTKDDNKDKFGKRFPAYEKSYVESKVFAAYGKSAGDINLTLTGDMLDAMTFKTTARQVVIMLDGQKNKDKAQGHIDGIRTGTGKRKKKDKKKGLSGHERKRGRDCYDANT